MSQNIQVNKEGFLFTKFLSDTIYQISKNGASPKFTIDFKNKRFDINAYPDLMVQPFSPILVEKFSWGATNPIETSQGLFFEYYDKNFPLGVFYNSNDGKGMIFNPMNIISDENIAPWPKYFKDGFYYGILTESDMGASLDKDTVDNYSSNSTIRKIYTLIKENQNPVIVKYKLNML